MKALKIFLMMLVFISPQIHAEDNGNTPEKAKSNEPAMVPIPGRNYEIGKYEVTQGEWRTVMGNNPSKFSSCGDACPVEMVSWNDTQEFIQKLNAKTGKQYRLPSEVEWEYACYGGRQSAYCGGNERNAVGWFSNNSTHPVGQKQANGFGLYDMSGNVWEWVSDCDGRGCTERILRGGSWHFGPYGIRPAYLYIDVAAKRDRIDAMYRSKVIGFRLARTLE